MCSDTNHHDDPMFTEEDDIEYVKNLNPHWFDSEGNEGEAETLTISKEAFADYTSAMMAFGKMIEMLNNTIAKAELMAETVVQAYNQLKRIGHATFFPDEPMEDEVAIPMEGDDVPEGMMERALEGKLSDADKEYVINKLKELGVDIDNVGPLPTLSDYRPGTYL